MKVATERLIDAHPKRLDCSSQLFGTTGMKLCQQKMICEFDAQKMRERRNKNPRVKFDNTKKILIFKPLFYLLFAQYTVFVATRRRRRLCPNSQRLFVQ